MDLPNDEIGASDILQFMECRQRWGFDMQRWTEAGEAPEATNPFNVYGSAIHLAIALTEEGMSDREAIEGALDKYGGFMHPDDFEQLEEDLVIYHTRDIQGVKTLVSEDNLRVPLFTHEGRTIYFRFTLDRLYQRIDYPSAFIHLDYKSSSQRKSSKEVHADVKTWAYNFAIYEYWPEVEDLYQIYDQLKFGQEGTRKNDEQRAQIKQWLIEMVKVILRADNMDPHFNKWCPWCPLMEGCSEPKRVSEFARTRIEALAPEGSDVVGLASQDIASYAAELETFETVGKCIKRYAESVKGVIRQLPDAERRALGFYLSPVGATSFPPPALKRIHELCGDDFYLISKITKTAITEFYGKDSDTQEAILKLGTKESQSPRLRRISN